MTESDYIAQLKSRWPKALTASSREVLGIAALAVRDFPRSAMLWYLRGQLLSTAPDDYFFSKLDAICSFEMAIEIDPTFADAYDELGRYYGGVKDDPDRAMQYYPESSAAAREATDVNNRLEGDRPRPRCEFRTREPCSPSSSFRQAVVLRIGRHLTAIQNAQTLQRCYVMNVELCPKCRSWRVTETKVDERTSYRCQECKFAWSASDKPKPSPSSQGEKPRGPEKPNDGKGKGRRKD